MSGAKFVGSRVINGATVSFFTPPHDEPDLLWVDFVQLARAFLPEEDAVRFLRHSRNFGLDGATPAATARRGDEIVTIVSHPVAQGFCGYVDLRNGVKVSDDDWGGGPAGVAYAVAMGTAQNEFAPMSFEQMGAAFHNAGGPSLGRLRGVE
jgi:hypothetical protein